MRYVNQLAELERQLGPIAQSNQNRPIKEVAPTDRTAKCPRALCDNQCRRRSEFASALVGMLRFPGNLDYATRARIEPKHANRLVFCVAGANNGQTYDPGRPTVADGNTRRKHLDHHCTAAVRPTSGIARPRRFSPSRECSQQVAWQRASGQKAVVGAHDSLGRWLPTRSVRHRQLRPARPTTRVLVGTNWSWYERRRRDWTPIVEQQKNCRGLSQFYRVFGTKSDGPRRARRFYVVL